MSANSAIDYGLDVVAQRFLRGNFLTWEDSVQDVIAHLGTKSLATRVAVYKNRRPLANPAIADIRYEWRRDAQEQLKSTDICMASYNPSWQQKLSQGELIQITDSHSDLFLVSTKSVIVVPVFAEDQWWGFWSFELDHEYHWSDDHSNMLNTIVTIFAAAIMRKRAEEELQKEKESVEAKVEERTKELQEKSNALEKARKKVEEAAATTAEQKAQLNASIESLPLAFIIINELKEVQLVNHVVNNMLELNEDNWTTDKLCGLFAPELDLNHHLDESVSTNIEVELDDIRFRDKYLQIHLAPIKLDDLSNRVIGLVILIRDVTETKIFQQARDEFFAVASHELRTPLTAIRGNASMALEYFPEIADNPRARELIEDVHLSSQRLIDIVNEYLDISRLETSGSELTIDKVELVSIVREVMHELEATALEKGLAWELQVDSELQVFAMADEGRAKQVLFNLMGNAIKYTDQGGIYVKVDYHDDKSRIVVYDTGRGISEEDQKRIFQKFKQAGDRKYQQGDANSTGIGLYIAKFIAEAMNGRVYIEKSIPGEGSGFAFEVPSAHL